MRSPAKASPQAWEAALRAALSGATADARGGPDDGLDIVARDGTWAIELKASLQGARDLHASLTQLAIYLDGHPGVRRATLVAHFPRMSAERAAHECARAQAIMRPDVAGRIALVALTPSGDSVAPADDPEARELAQIARRALDGAGPRRSTQPASVPWSPKTYEVWKILLDAWLRREPPLPLHEIQRRSGASYPSVVSLLDRLETTGELARTTNRSATLTAYPRRSLAEVLALGDGLRETHRFIDRTGRAPDMRDLVRRVISKGGRGVALGGVEGARYYMPTFDLNGLPRVDVTVAAHDELAWVRKVDAGLAEGPSSTTPCALVVHRVRRRDPRFEQTPTGETFADPAEVLLDLHELRLIEQADEYVRAMRKGNAP